MMSLDIVPYNEKLSNKAPKPDGFAAAWLTRYT